MGDGRDWVRIVADERCPECGLAASSLERADLADAIQGESGRWRLLLSGSDGPGVRIRPAPCRWSALEYACHVRDVLVVFADRVALALDTDDPVFGWWDHEAAVLEDGYNAQAPPAVAAALDDAADRWARMLGRLPAAGWSRRGTRRQGESFTVEGMARFVLHEARHHRHDAELSLVGAE